MRRFTYEQCDMIHKKMNNFDSVLGKIQISNSIPVQKQVSKKQSENRLGRALREKDFNVSRELMNNYQSGTHAGQGDGRKGSVLEEERNGKMGKENFGRGVEKRSQIRLYEERKYETLKAPAYKQLPNKPNPMPSSIHPNQSLSYSTIHPEPASCTSHILQQGYSSITHDHSSHLRQDKSSTINELNTQIKQIMSKYDYEWGREEVRMMVEERVTLPSFRANDAREIRMKHKKSHGYIRVEESASEEDVLRPENSKKDQNEFSPYSDHQYQGYSSAVPLSTQPMIKKQKPQNPSTQTNNNLCLTYKINPTHSLYGKNDPNQQIPMCKSQLLEQERIKKPLNLNRGQNAPNLVRHQPHQALLESSQKKMARYMQGYNNLAARKHHRMDADSMPKNRSEIIDKSIEELNQRMREVEQKKKLLKMDLRPFKLDTFNSKLVNHHHYGHDDSHPGIDVYPSFQIKKQEAKPVKQKVPQKKEDDNCQPHIRFIVQKQHEAPTQSQARASKEDANNSPFTNSNSSQFPQSHCYQSFNDTNNHLQITVNGPATSQKANEPVICQIDSLFNGVSLEGQSECGSKKGDKAEENVNQGKKSAVNSIKQSQIMEADASMGLTTNFHEKITTDLSANEKQTMNKSSLVIVSGTNTLTIPAINDSSFSVQEQSAFWPQPSVQQKSAQKRLNRSSLLVKKPQNTKNALQLLLINLIQQIGLDQQFRSYKTWFQFYCDSPNKHEQLKTLFLQKLTKRKEQLSVKRQFFDSQQKAMEDIATEERLIWMMERDLPLIEQAFAVSANEHDPFFTLQANHKSSIQTVYNASNQQHYCIESLIGKYEACQSHWVKQLYKKFSCQQLLGCGFASGQLDLERKGHVQLQDFVRLINMNVGSGYRNRDLVAVWERMHQTKLQESKQISSNRSSNITKPPQIEFKFVLMAFTKRDKI